MVSSAAVHLSLEGMAIDDEAASYHERTEAGRDDRAGAQEAEARSSLGPRHLAVRHHVAEVRRELLLERNESILLETEPVAAGRQILEHDATGFGARRALGRAGQGDPDVGNRRAGRVGDEHGKRDTAPAARAGALRRQRRGPDGEQTQQQNPDRAHY